MGLARIFDHHKAEAFRDLQDAVHIRRLAVEMNWDDRTNVLPGCTMHERAISIPRALVLEIVLESCRIHVVGSLIDVDKSRIRSRLGDGFGSGNEGVGNRDHDVVLSDSGSDKNEAQCVCTIADACVVGKCLPAAAGARQSGVPGSTAVLCR